jgi:UDP-glucose 4-epimerase
MNILAIGGSGFIGHHLVKALRDAGHDVAVLGRSKEPARGLPDGVRYLCGSTLDRSYLAENLCGFDAVAHLATTTVPSTGDRDPSADVSHNLVGTINLLDAMVEKGIERLLFLSSGGTVYGPPRDIPVKETHRLSPTCSYGIVKSAIEMYLELYARNSGLRYVSIRASNPYGPLQGNLGVQGIIGTFLSRILEGKPLEIWGDGSVVRDYIFISDLTQLCVRALESSKVGAYNGGSGIGTSVQDIANLVQYTTGNDAEVIYHPSRGVDVPVSVLDVSRAQADFNWKAEVDLHEGVKRTWRSI